MGAAASVRQIYSDGISWFKKYFDEDLYLQDFKSMDKDNSGGISYLELERWIKAKSQEEGGGWTFMISNPIIIKIAHAQAVCRSTAVAFNPHVVNQKAVGLGDFRNLLVHLFAISILWVHFKNADEWVEGYDFGNLSLSLEEFKLACRTVSASHANEALTEEQIEKDFQMLDLNKNGSLAFLEVCEYCCKYINNEFERKLEESTAANAYTLSESLKNGRNNFAIDSDLLVTGDSNPPSKSKKIEAPIEVLLDLQEVSSTKASNQFKPVSEKNSQAIEAMAKELQNNQTVADFVEVKVSTENQINRLFSQ